MAPAPSLLGMSRQTSLNTSSVEDVAAAIAAWTKAHGYELVETIGPGVARWFNPTCGYAITECRGDMGSIAYNVSGGTHTIWYTRSVLP